MRLGSQDSLALNWSDRPHLSDGEAEVWKPRGTQTQQLNALHRDCIPPLPPRPHQHAYGSQGGDEQSPARVSLEELHLSPSSELQDGPETEETEPKSPEGTVQGSLGPAEAEEADEQVMVAPFGVRVHPAPWAGSVSADRLLSRLS